jgi:uncharacterized membrane protein
MNNMANDLRLCDKRESADKFPLWSAHFLITSFCGLGCVAFDVYLLCRHSHGQTLDAIFFLGVLILFPLIVSYLEVLRHYAKVKGACSVHSSDEKETIDQLSYAFRIAMAGIADVLFWAYAALIFAMLYISILLTHAGGMK